MNAEGRRRVHTVLWDWTILAYHDCKKVDARLDLARSLRRLVTDETHIVDIFKLWKRENDRRVQVILSWAVYHFLARGPVYRCVAIYPYIIELLKNESLTRRTLCCALVTNLNRVGCVAEEQLIHLDPLMAKILSEYSLRSDRAVEAVMRYFSLRPSSGLAAIPLDHVFPCGGLGWSMAMEEYIARQTHVHPPPLTTIAPMPSHLEIGEVVGTLSAKAQTAFVKIVASSGASIAEENGPLIDIVFTALRNCFKAAAETLSPIVPTVVHVLLTMGETIDPEYHLQLWDSGWAIFELIMSSPSAARVGRKHVSCMLDLLYRIPEHSTCWSRERARRVLALIFEEVPDAFEHVSESWMWPSTLDVLPPPLLHRHMSSLVFKLAVRSCKRSSALASHDITCLRLLCHMNEAERDGHHDFVEHHVDVFRRLTIQCVSEPHLRLCVREMLVKVPPSLFIACIPALTTMIDAGHSVGLSLIYTLPPERLQFLKPALFRRVLDSWDVYTDESRPSLALSIVARLPFDLLTPLVNNLVEPDLPSAHNYASKMPLEDRLFILRHLPCQHLLDETQVTKIGITYIVHESIVVTEFAMAIVVKSQNLQVCKDFAGWAMYLLQHGPMNVWII